MKEKAMNGFSRMSGAIAVALALASTACAQNETDATVAPAPPPSVTATPAKPNPKGETLTVRPRGTSDDRTGTTIVSGINNITIVRPRDSAPLKKEKGSYLGVSASPASAALRYQIGLKPGFGLVVDSVEPGSPAEDAGLKRFDILSKFDDQQLINADQFLVLVRSKSPGEALTLSVIREGKTVILNTKTVEKDVTPLADVITPPKSMIYLGNGATAASYEATLDTARGLLKNSRENSPWSTYAKKQITDDVSGQTWTFSWEGDDQLLRVDYGNHGDKKVFMYSFTHPEKAALPDEIKKAMDAYMERKKTSVDEIYKSIAPKKGDPWQEKSGAPGV
jgi:PDZ domain